MALNDEEKAFIRSYVAEATNDELATARREECAESFGVSLPTIRAITAWTKIRANRSVVSTNVAETAAEDPAIVVESEVVEKIDAPKTGGEHVNYDSEIKRKWRAKMAEFIDGHTDVTRRADMKVICLPGKECLEIPTYLDLGFSPANILGVEGGDADAREVFSRNAERYGIRTFLGDLEECVSSTEEKFDVVSYDFLGPSCAKYEHIMEATPVAERSLVLLNMMMKRETKRAQYMMQAHSPLCLEKIAEDLKQKRVSVAQMMEEFTRVMKSNLDQEAELNPIGDMRAGSLVALYSQKIGQRRLDRQPFGDRFNVLNYPHVQEVFINLGAAVEKTVLDHKMRMPEGHVLRGMRGIISAGLHRLSMLTDEKEYKYLSTVGRTSSPFHSVFMKLHSPSEEYHRMRHTIDFILRVGEAFAEKPEEVFRAALYDKRHAPRQEKSPVGPRDIIRILDANNSSVASIEVKRLMHDIESYLALARTDLKVRIIAGTHVSEIEEIA